MTTTWPGPERMTEQETSRGRTRITPRAFNRIVAAVAAQSLDVTPPVRIVGLAAAGLTSAGIVAVAVARAFARK
jgi:hypothetical protein